MENVEINNSNNEYTVFAVNIKYGKVLNEKINNRPSITTIIIPERITKCRDNSKINDLIETYVYDYLTRRYGAEVNYCQVYLPLEK